VSDNSRRLWDLGTARAIGYAPRDDAEDYAAELDAMTEDALEARFHGGSFCAEGFDGDPGRID
jgi:uronate dehydrogenase